MEQRTPSFYYEVGCNRLRVNQEEKIDGTKSPVTGVRRGKKEKKGRLTRKTKRRKSFLGEGLF